MKNEGKGDGAGEGEGKGEGEGRRQSSPPHSSTLRSARTSGNALVVYEMSRQVLPTAPSPTITHFTFCIIVLCTSIRALYQLGLVKRAPHAPVVFT